MKKAFVLIFGILFLTNAIWWAKSFNEEKIQTRNKPPTVITLWVTAESGKAMLPLIERFETTHPGQKINLRSFASERELTDILEQQVAPKPTVSADPPITASTASQASQEAGPEELPPDVALVPVAWLNANEGSVIPKSKFDLTSFAPVIQQSLVKNDLLYGLPLAIDTLALYYSSRFYPDGPAITWSALGEQTRGISRAGVALGSVDTITLGWDILKVWMLQNGIGTTAPDLQKLREVVGLFVDFAYPIARYYNWAPLLTKGNSDLEIDTFVQGRVAAIVGYQELGKILAAKVTAYDTENRPHINPDLIRVAKLPQFNPANPVNLALLHPLIVMKTTQHSKAAWELIEAFTGPESMKTYNLFTNTAPSRTDVSIENPTKEASLFIEQMPTASSVDLSPAQQSDLKRILDLSSKNRNYVSEVEKLKW